MASYILYSPTEGSHADATTLITHDAAIYAGDYDDDGTDGDDPIGAVTNIWASGGDANGTSLGVGNGDLGSSGANELMNSLLRITLPEGPKTSPTGDLIKDTNTVINKIVLKINVKSVTTTGSNPARIAVSPMIRPVSMIDYATVTWKTSDGTTIWTAPGAQGTGDRDTETDFKTGSDGVVAKHILTEGWNEITIQDTTMAGPASPATLGLTWGQTVDLILWPHSPTALSNAANYCRIYGLEGVHDAVVKKPYLEVHYEDNAPAKPEIKATPLDDYRHANVEFTKRTEDEDLTQYVMSWRQGGTPVYATGDSDPSYGKALTDTGKESYHAYNDLYNDGLGNTTFFPGGSSDVGTTNQLTVWAEDSNNTGATNATKGNTVSITRYQPFTIETFTDANYQKSCTVSWIVIGKHTGSNNASVLTDTGGSDYYVWKRGNFVKNGVEIGDIAYNITDLAGSTPSMGIISAVTDSTVSVAAWGSGTDDNVDTNDVYVIRSWIDIGEKVSLTVRSTLVEGLQFDTIGVNWTNISSSFNDDSSFNLDDFDIIKLDSPSTEHTVSFRYSSAGTYYPLFFFVDAATGFRTPVMQMGKHNSSTETGYALDASAVAAAYVRQPPPEPRITSSKSIGESANVALDRGSAVIYSGANSTSAGADAYVKSYHWLGEPQAGQILTQGCLDINNTPLVNESKKLYMRCNKGDYSASVFTIYGLASFQADNATPVKDTDTSFSHYRYVKATVSSGSAAYLKHDTVNAFGNAARTTSDAPSTEVFFKQVDFVYCTTKSSTGGAEECFQLLAADSDNDGSIDAAGTLDTSTLCKRLSVDSNNGSPSYEWGGYIYAAGSGMTFTKNTGADTITGKDWITAGFAPGDTITIENTSNDGVYTVQKIETTSGPVYTMYLNEELVTDETIAGTVYTTQPTISVASSAAGTAKISLKVRDNLAEYSDSSVNIYTTFRDQTYLDFNASADSGYIAIQNASLTRSGGITASMPLGERRYPHSAVHTKHGLPKMAMTVRIVDVTGFNRMYRLLNNSYNYAVYQHHDTDFATWVKYRLKLESFTVNRDPQNLQHQVVNLSFFIVGEEV